MASLTLLRQGNPLASGSRQVELLEGSAALKPFGQALADHGLPSLAATAIEVLQVNVGRLCNQTCGHCHVDAGPERREIMSRKTLQACLDVVASAGIPVVDITGGAPEMNPDFRWFVAEVRRLGRKVIDRCNLTILLAPGYDDLPEFLAGQQVEIIASLPCYLEQNVDAQRGDGVFGRSIDALRRLNGLGYGQPESPLALHLVYNPVGPSLPPAQAKLEEAYHRELQTRYGVVFHRLYTITNMPISRFLDVSACESGNYEAIHGEDWPAPLIPPPRPVIMCRYDDLSGLATEALYDCDFNQMLELPLIPGSPQTIFEFDAALLSHRPIVTGRHCYGCTAGAGSSCQGTIA